MNVRPSYEKYVKPLRPHRTGVFPLPTNKDNVSLRSPLSRTDISDSFKITFMVPSFTAPWRWPRIPWRPCQGKGWGQASQRICPEGKLEPSNGPACLLEPSVAFTCILRSLSFSESPDLFSVPCFHPQGSHRKPFYLLLLSSHKAGCSFQLLM